MSDTSHLRPTVWLSRLLGFCFLVNASFAWVAAVVIAIAFIFIVIIVGIWLCTRDRGETYKLSKKEYKLGNDPLRELKEKETFQAYERP